MDAGSSSGAAGSSPQRTSGTVTDGWKRYYYDDGPGKPHRAWYYHRATGAWSDEFPSSQSPPPAPPLGRAQAQRPRAGAAAASAAASSSTSGASASGNMQPPPAQPIAGKGSLSAASAAAARLHDINSTKDAERSFRTYAQHDIDKLEKDIEEKKRKGLPYAAEMRHLSDLIVSEPTG